MEIQDLLHINRAFQNAKLHGAIIFQLFFSSGEIDTYTYLSIRIILMCNFSSETLLKNKQFSNELKWHFLSSFQTVFKEYNKNFKRNVI